MVSKTVFTFFALYSLGCLLALINARSTKYQELKPVLIKSVVSHPRLPVFNNFEEESQPQNSQEEQVQGGQGDEGRSSRKIYQFPGPGQHHHQSNNNNNRRPAGPPPPPQQQQQNDPERGQILHRPKSGRRNTQQSSSSSQTYHHNNQNEMPNDAPMVLGSGGKGKKVKYVPTTGGGFQGPEKPPQIYVISNGDDDEDNNGSGVGVVGSMQTYFKSFTGRMRAAFQGLIGGITD